MVADLLKSLESSLIFQLVVGCVAAFIIGLRVLDQFKKGMSTDPPPKPDGTDDMRRCADALESIAESFRLFNRREEQGEEREEREALRNLLMDMQRKINALERTPG